MSTPNAAPEDHLLVRRDGPVATVVLNRPAQRNAITQAMWEALPGLLAQVGADPAVRVVQVTGAGEQAFSAGADIKEFERTRSTPEQARAYRHAVEAAGEALAHLHQPTVAVVRGHCLGGGFELALHADLRVAADDASFGLPAAKRGLAASHQHTARLVALAGLGGASYILLSARTIGAVEALRLGLVNAVVPATELDAYAATLAGELSALSPVTHRVHKQVMADVLTHGGPAQVPVDRLDLPSIAESSEDFREGVRSFLEKRSPRFPGR
jgi:enoyl-CoA hydratase/carnithine racemase